MNDASTGAMQHFRMTPKSGSGGPRAALVLLYAEGYGVLSSAYPLTGPVVLGRDANNQVALPVPAVSRKHAEVRSERGQFMVRDLGSTNGTRLDGEMLGKGAVPLDETGQEITFGAAKLRLSRLV
ncbi:MAG TPA: FHA domain-containing protein [Polyangiaceae bacterium]|nr:FHA domain-containing protein [Polyangiaceae bacterium]